MIRVILGLIFCSVLPVAAQYRGGGVPHRGITSPPARGMYGGVSTGQIVGSINDPGFAGRLGATVSGLPQTTSRIPIQGGHYPSGIYGRTPLYPGRYNTVVVPWGMPIYSGGYPLAGGYNYDPVPQAQMMLPEDNQPSVIINQYFTPQSVNPQMKEYSNLPEAAPRPAAPPKQAAVYPPTARVDENANKPTITHLVLQGGDVLEAIGYWTQGDTLYYITPSYEKKHLPASRLDRDASLKRNQERDVEFKLESLR